MPFSSPGDLPDPGIEPGSPESLADALPSEPPGNRIPGLIEMSLVGVVATKVNATVKSSETVPIT